ncbi:unnamed protein product, partial [Mesorhabditis belari]|uniref:Neurotransmitter-gated ion-channel ligand-binding domain-containing protein n=1 Tax=Mesorhabditis belari TaxID=2138241 RepID=A0AAF3EH56_9BILA
MFGKDYDDEREVSDDSNGNELNQPEFASENLEQVYKKSAEIGDKDENSDDSAQDAEILAERDSARSSLIKQADKMLQASKERFQPLDVGKNVRIPINPVDRPKIGHRNLLGVVTEAIDGLYTIGTANGTLPQKFSSETDFLVNADVPECSTSFRAAIGDSSIHGKQSHKHCLCAGKCSSDRFSGFEPNYLEFYESEKYTNYMELATKLYDELFTKRSYNKYLSPVYEELGNETEAESPPLSVNFDLEYFKLFNLTWLDPRLSWKPEEFGGMQNLYVNADIAWMPDNQFGNVKSLDDIMPGAGKALKLSRNGSVQMMSVFFVEISCIIQIKNFPFDKQTCFLPIMSFSYNSNLVVTNGFVNPNTVNRLLNESGNGEWQVKQIGQRSYPFGRQQIMELVVEMKRVPNYYVYVIALPCFIITFLAIIGMFWTKNFESEQLEKLGIGLTSLVSMTVLLEMLSNSIPKTAVFPLLGIYVVCSVGIIAIACLLIMVISKKDPCKKSALEMKKLLEAENSLSTRERQLKALKEKLFQNHILLQAILQALNCIGFIVFLSHWD